jgi:hypothetical protein
MKRAILLAFLLLPAPVIAEEPPTLAVGTALLGEGATALQPCAE